MKDKDSALPRFTGAKEVASAFLRARINSRASNALSSVSKHLRVSLAPPNIRDWSVRLRRHPENINLEYITSPTLVSTTYDHDTIPLPLASSYQHGYLKGGQDLPQTSSARCPAASKRRAHAHTSPFPIVLDVASRSLSTLEFTELWDPLHPSFFTALAQCSSVTTLRLNVAWLYNFHQLRRLVSALRGLKHLHIGDVNSQLQHDIADGVSEPRSLQLPTFAPVSTRLETLVMHVSSSVHPIQHAAFIQWLASTFVCESLKTLKFMGPRDISEALVAQADLLIEAAGPSLQDLRNPYLCYVEHDLSRNSNLMSLDFKIYIYGWGSFLDDLRSVLSTISSSHLLHIRILCNWEPTALQDVPLAIELERLHRVMKRSNYNSLTRVEVNVTAAEYTLVGDEVTEIEAGFRALFAPWGGNLSLKMLIEENK